MRAEAGRADSGEPWRLARGGLGGHAWRWLPQEAPGWVEGAVKRPRVGLPLALPPGAPASAGAQASSQRAPALGWI